MDISLIRFQHVVKYPVSILASVVEHRRSDGLQGRGATHN